MMMMWTTLVILTLLLCLSIVVVIVDGNINNSNNNEIILCVFVKQYEATNRRCVIKILIKIQCTAGAKRQFILSYSDSPST